MGSGPTSATADGRQTAKPPAPSDASRVLYVPATRERAAVRHRLQASGRRIEVAAGMTDALQRLADQPVDICLIDLADDRAAIPLIRMLVSQYPAIAVVAVADPANPVLAAEALGSGVADVLPWPFDESDLVCGLANARDHTAGDFGAPASRDDASPVIFCHSPAMQQTMGALRSAASSEAPLGLCGERGSGRELLARVLHGRMAGSEQARPFVVLDCALGSPRDLEERLFGVASEGSGSKTSYAGERVGRRGAVVVARGGTLLLKSLTEAPARIQRRLGRLLRDGEAMLEGEGTMGALEIRAIAAFDPDLDAAVAEGRLREELVDRFGSRIEVPPLRRRREDIPVLAVHLLRRLTAHGLAPKRLSRSSLALLGALPWPGNGHELHTLLEQLANTVGAPVVQIDDVLEHAPLEGLTARVEAGVSLREARARFERDCIAAVLVRHRGRVGEAAKALGIQRTNLYRKMRQLNVAKSLLSTRK